MSLLSPSDLLARLQEGRPILADGAMGSELIGQGIAAEATVLANLSHAPAVRSVHKGYLAAGAELISTNTFGLPGVHDLWLDAVAQGLNLAAACAESVDRRVGIVIALPGHLEAEDWQAAARLIGAFQNSYCLLLVETCTGLAQAQAAVSALRGFGWPQPIAVTAYFRTDGAMPDGTSAALFARQMIAAGARIVGANCGDTPESYLPVVEAMAKATESPILVQPSAGLPSRDDMGTLRYPVGPERFSDVVLQLVGAGAKIIGGCCGTTYSHIAAAHKRLKNWEDSS